MLHKVLNAVYFVLYKLHKVLYITYKVLTETCKAGNKKNDGCGNKGKKDLKSKILTW